MVFLLIMKNNCEIVIREGHKQRKKKKRKILFALLFIRGPYFWIYRVLTLITIDLLYLSLYAYQCLFIHPVKYSPHIFISCSTQTGLRCTATGRLWATAARHWGPFASLPAVCAAWRQLRPRQAYAYLKRFGLKRIEENDVILHTLSFRDSIDAMTQVCAQHGGKVKW